MKSINQLNHSSDKKTTETRQMPADWTTETLGAAGRWLSGGTPPMSDQSNWIGTIPWVSPKDMKVSRLYDAADHISEKALTRGARLAPKNALLLVVRGMILAHSFPIARAERELAFNQDIKALVPRDSIDSNYLLWWLQANRNVLLSITTESTHGTKRVPSDALFAQEIALPPTLAEQEAIAAALSDADALIESLERLIAKKRDIKQGAMQELLRPKASWKAINVGELGVFLKGSGVRKDQCNTGSIPCVRYGEIYTLHDDYIKSFYSWISRDVVLTAVRILPGDLLFAGSGETRNDIGKCVAFAQDIEAYAGGDIVILRPLAEVNSIFLGYLMNSPIVGRQKANRGQGDAVVHISASALATINISIPAAQEQTRIAGVILDMDAEIAVLEARVAKARLVKQGMMQELLTGRIRLV